MKCPYCGYDKVQPNFNFCPKCKHPLTQQDRIENHSQQSHSQDAPVGHQASQEKWWGSRLLHPWTYDKAINDLHGYVEWARRNPNDNRYYLDRWERAGENVDVIRQAIREELRARRENPTVDEVDREGYVIDASQQEARREANRNFVNEANAGYTTDAAAIVRNKAIWKLQAGELARHIAPDEWGYVTEHLEGIVIEEGTTAIVYVDGQEVAQMGSGMYVFDDKHAAAADLEAARRVNERERGFFARIADGIYRLFTGHKREESAREREARHRRVQQIMGRMKKDTIVDVYLKSDRVFPAIFGQKHSDESEDGYQPYVIQSRYLDLQVGVSMQMQIGDFKEFIANYMAGRKTVSIADVVRSADHSVYSILRYQLRDIEVSERGLDEGTFNAIVRHLKQNLPNILHGVQIIDILDIATTSADLARFRQVEEQLYCSERDYDFLLRTNEFRNRIASEENDQKIREARSEQELRIRLDEVNKDNLIHTDEMEQFVSLLMNEKVLREATNKVDLDSAMRDIQKNDLISQEEFDIFSNDMADRRFDREQVSEQLRARSLMATAIQKLEVDKTLRITNIRNVEEISEEEWNVFRKQKAREEEGIDIEAAIYSRKFVFEKQQLLDDLEKRRINREFGVEEAQIDNKISAVVTEGDRQRAEYADERVMKQHEISEKVKDDEYKRKLREQEDNIRLTEQQLDINMSATERQARMAMDNMRAMQEMELNKQKEEHAHEQVIAGMQVDVKKTEIAAEQNMTAEQLVGRKIAQMDAGAQAKFAESFSHLNEIELTKANAETQAKLYAEMLEMAKQHNIDTRNLQTDNSKQQMDVMKQMIDAFREINSTQAGGQQNMVNSMIGAMSNVAAGRMNDMQNMKEEYRTQMQHEQARVDENQKQSLHYTTRVKVSENMPFVAGGTAVNVNVGTRTCPGCGEPILDKDAACCPLCGCDLK